jgi:hypothetical protein
MGIKALNDVNRHHDFKIRAGRSNIRDNAIGSESFLDGFKERLPSIPISLRQIGRLGIFVCGLAHSSSIDNHMSVTILQRCYHTVGQVLEQIARANPRSTTR